MMGMMNEDRIVLSLGFTYTSSYLQSVSVTWILNKIGIQFKANEYGLRHYCSKFDDLISPKSS